MAPYEDLRSMISRILLSTVVMALLISATVPKLAEAKLLDLGFSSVTVMDGRAAPLERPFNVITPFAEVAALNSVFWTATAELMDISKASNPSLPMTPWTREPPGIVKVMRSPSVRLRLLKLRVEEAWVESAIVIDTPPIDFDFPPSAYPLNVKLPVPSLE